MRMTAAQMSALANASTEHYLDRVIELVTDDDEPDERDPEIRATCLRMIERARAAGFSTELEIATFVLCGCTFGTDFDSRTDDLPFYRILHDAGTAPRLKAAQMLMVLEQSPNESGQGWGNDHAV